MAKNKNPNSEQPSPPKDENSNGEIDRRLTALEKSTADLNSRIFDSHKWFVTVLFSAVAVVLTVYGVLSRLDVRDSTNEMEKRVNAATSDMEKRFQALAGEALKKPAVELKCEDAALENALIELTAPANVSPTEASLNTLFIKNIGDKRTEPLSIRFSAAAPVRLSWDYRQNWEPATSYEKDFAVSFYSTRHDTVAPGETLNIHPLLFDGQSFPPGFITNVLCKIQV